MTAALDFVLGSESAAHEPPEARGRSRDQVRLMVGRTSTPTVVSHHRFTDLPLLLDPGDVLVVNTSATLPAAVSTLDGSLVVHLSTPLADGTWLVELRQPDGGATSPYAGGSSGQRLRLVGGGQVTLRAPYTDRLWIAALDIASVPDYLMSHGRPIRYSYVDRDWPLSAYQTVFGTRPGSAEMPSASRPFTRAVVRRLVARGVVIAPITLHTGVASPEAHERPYPERFEVPRRSARLVNQARSEGRRVVAIGTTAARAIETAARPDGTLAPASGWTELIITSERGVWTINALLTGFHEPRASHLMMLEAVVGQRVLSVCYAQALESRYLWHEFGDLNLLIADGQ
jgi:S-adenosylmethionine:tRNA ribosyltransferase-isomerase